MADVSPTNVWPELDGKRVSGRAQTALWQRFSTDLKTWVTTSSSAGTHWSVGLSSMVGFQPYPGTSSRMMLKGAHSALIQYAQEAADTTFYWHDDIWLSTDGSGNAIFATSSSEEALYFGSSSSTGIFAISTAQYSTTVYYGTAMPMDKRGVRIWERGT